MTIVMEEDQLHPCTVHSAQCSCSLLQMITGTDSFEYASDSHMHQREGHNYRLCHVCLVFLISEHDTLLLLWHTVH